MQSKATTVAQYLDSLPPDRRAAIETVRQTVLANVDDKVEEGMQYGMIGFYVPHRVFPAGYHCDPKQPLPYIALASQKNYMSLYLMTAYMDQGDEDWLRTRWEATGRKLDMGKCCVRFKRIQDVPLDVLAEAIRRVPTDAHIARYQAGLTKTGAKPKPAAKKASKTVSKTATKTTSKPTKPK